MQILSVDSRYGAKPYDEDNGHIGVNFFNKVTFLHICMYKVPFFLLGFLRKVLAQTSPDLSSK